MMDKEIELPSYTAMLQRVLDRIDNLPGTLVDTACGTGHVLELYHDQFDNRRQLLGIDLSPHMVELANRRLQAKGKAEVGNMCKLDGIPPESAAAVLNIYALHHLAADAAGSAVKEWARILKPAGMLSIVTWEGTGTIDYGDASDIIALRHSPQSLQDWCSSAGLDVLQCETEPVEGFPMDAVFLEAVKPL